MESRWYCAIERGHSPNKELYLISDMQRRGWEEQGAAVVVAEPLEPLEADGHHHVARTDGHPAGGASADELASLALEYGFDTFLIGEDQMQPFVADVAPRVREMIAAGRGSR